MLDLPGPAFARLEAADTAWPEIKRDERDVGGKFLGYVLDKARRPAFRYRIHGVEIVEQPSPDLRADGAGLRRTFILSPDEGATDLHFLAWRGEDIREVAKDTWRSGTITIRLSLQDGQTVRLRKVDDEKELLVRTPFRGKPVRFAEVISW